jgi:hypothetical protein
MLQGILQELAQCFPVDTLREMSDRHPIRNSVIAGLLVLGIAWFVVKVVPGVSRAVKPALGWLGEALVSTVGVPAWLVVLLGVYLLVVTVLLVKRWAASALTDYERPPTSKPKAGPPQVDDVQALIIAVLVQADGTPFDLDQLASRVQQRRLRTEQALEGLMQLGLIEDYLSIIHPTKYGLSSLGRDFALSRLPSEGA